MGRFGSDHHHDHGGFDHFGGATTTYTLTSGVDTISATGNATLIATAGTLATGDVINLTGRNNTLVLSGAGSFDLTAPTTLTGINMISGDATAAQTITLASASLRLNGGNGNITLTSLTGNEFISLGNGNDTVTLGSGSTLLSLGNGNDSVKLGTGATKIGLGSGTNTITGSTGTLEVYASSGTDTITADGGATIVHAGTGTDTITSSTGALTVFTGAGKTTVTNSSAADTLVITNQAGTVTLNSFTHGSDTISLAQLGIQSWTALQAAATIASDGSGGTLLTFTNGAKVDLVGVAAVTTADFTYASAPTHFDWFWH